MPKAKTRTAPGLSIRLKDDKTFYSSGSVIEGDVTLSADADIAIGVVTINLYAREKVFFVQHHGQGESYWKGRAPLFSRSSMLYEGKHTHKPGSYSWPFEFTIPNCPDKSPLQDKKYSWKPRSPFKATQDEVENHALPGSFNYKKWGFGYRFHAYVEYVLEVTQLEAEEATFMRQSKKRTVIPLKVIQPPTSDLVTSPLPGIEFSLPPGMPEKTLSHTCDSGKQPPQHLVSQTTTHTVKSFKLVRQYQDEKLSFRKKASSLFNSSDVPSFTFMATISRPDKVRVLDNVAIPFHVNFTPVSDPGKTSINDQEYPDIGIETLTLSLRATTYIRCKSLGIRRNESTSYEIQLLDRQLVGYDVVLNQDGRAQVNTAPLSKDVSPARSEAKKGDVDLSRLPGLAVTLTAAKLGSNTESPLSPTFSGYVLAREYELRWKLELDVAGQKVKVESEGDRNIVVLPAPYEQTAKYLTSGMTAAMMAEEEEADDSDSEDDDDEEGSKSLASKMSKLLSSGSSKKKSKEAEAAEEREQARVEETGEQSLPRYEDALGEPVTVPGEALPKYEK